MGTSSPVERPADLTPGPFPPREGVPKSDQSCFTRASGAIGTPEEGTPSLRGKGPGVRSDSASRHGRVRIQKQLSGRRAAWREFKVPGSKIKVGHFEL